MNNRESTMNGDKLKIQSINDVRACYQIKKDFLLY